MHRIALLLSSLFLLCILCPQTSQAVPVVASFSVTATTVCQDSCLTLTSTSTGTIDSIRWKMIIAGSPILLANVTPSKTCFTSSIPAGTYVIRLVVYGGGVADSSSSSITLNQTPHPVITRSGHTLSVSGSYSSYQWYDDILPISGATTSSYTFATGGDYSVLVDSGGCAAASNIITTNTLNVNTTQDADNSYWIPQAANDLLVINSRQPISEQMRIDIRDQAGRKVISNTWAPGNSTQQINTASFPRGTYFILLSNSNTRKTLRWTKH